MQTGGRSAYGALVSGENGLVVLYVFGSGLLFYPFGNIGFTKGEKGLLEILVRAVEEETQGASSGGCIVDDFGHKGLILTEIQLVADTYFPCRIHDDIPESLFAVKLPQEENHDVGPGLFLLAVEAGGEDLRVIEDEYVTFSEIVDDVLEQAVLDFAGVLVENHKAGLIPPLGGILGDAFLREFEVELGQFHFSSFRRYYINTADSA